MRMKGPHGEVPCCYDQHCRHPLFFSVNVHGLKVILGTFIQFYQVRLPEISLSRPHVPYISGNTKTQLQEEFTPDLGNMKLNDRKISR